MAGVAIIGCGLIGRKRAASLAGANLVACVDVNRERALALAALYQNVAVYEDWRDVIRCKDVDIVVVATTNNMLAEIAAAATRDGKHVLVEKPAARDVSELDAVLAAARMGRGLVRVGFNHRYHPSFLKIRQILQTEDCGDLMFVRGRYGHGGRLGYEKEWRADPLVSGGGELIDQGVHLIDLSRVLLGEFVSVDGFADKFFWDMPVDDNGFMVLRTGSGKTAFLHVSCTEWKNMFSLEIYCRRAKLHWEGLGGSYGGEKLTFYRMLPQMGPPETTCWDFSGKDESWHLEFTEFMEDIKSGRQPSAGLDDARAAMDVVSKIYQKSGFCFTYDGKAVSRGAK